MRIDERHATITVSGRDKGKLTERDTLTRWYHYTLDPNSLAYKRDAKAAQPTALAPLLRNWRRVSSRTYSSKRLIERPRPRWRM